MTTPVSVVPTIETTAAMARSGFAVPAQIALNAFVGGLTAGDPLCVATAGDPGAVGWPATGGLVAVDATLSQILQAQQAINALTFTDAASNLVGGLTAAYAALNSSPAGNNNGVVLVATGNGLTGGDPLALPAYAPTHCCAPGPSANTTLLQQLAVLSKGTYHYAPTNADMATILNQIRGARPGWATLFNQATTVQPTDYWLPPVAVAAGQAQLQFSVVWENTALAWTGSANPGAGEISVTVVKPPGVVLAAATLSGAGFCVYDIANPPAGTWYIQVMYPGTTPLGVTGAAFAAPAASAALPVLRLAHGDGGDLRGSVTMDGVARLDPVVVETVRHGPDGGRREAVVVAAAADGGFGLTPAFAGGYTCTVRVGGTLADTGSLFVLTEVLTVHR